MLSEKKLADIQLKMKEVSYLWNDNFIPDLERFLNRLSASKEAYIGEEESYSSFASVFVKPKNPSGYGLARQEKVDNEQTIDNDDNDFTAARLGR